MALRIYDVTIEMVGGVSKIARVVQRVDPDLARQMRRASSSVPLNLSEGMYSQGGNARARFYTSMGSARETMACLDVAAAAGYVPREAVVAERDRLDRIVGTLYKLIHR